VQRQGATATAGFATRDTVGLSVGPCGGSATSLVAGGLAFSDVRVEKWVNWEDSSSPPAPPSSPWEG